MFRSLLKSKIHRATVTDADLHYEGSISIDKGLLEAANILPYEHVHVWDVTNGNRFETYTLEAPLGSATICVNGAAAHLVKKGDIIIVTSFMTMPEELCASYEPIVVLVDEHNQIVSEKSTLRPKIIG